MTSNIADAKQKGAIWGFLHAYKVPTDPDVAVVGTDRNVIVSDQVFPIPQTEIEEWLYDY